MPTYTICPDVSTLQRFLRGGAPAGKAEFVGAHLAHCDRCAALAQASRVEPKPSAALSYGGTPSVGLTASAAAGGATTAWRSLPTSSVPAPADQERFDFLAPAEGPGELGRLGSYRVLNVLGAGGMGVVFEAEDPQLQRHVALKVIRPAQASDPSARKRFLREARAAAAIEHDHIVHINEVGEDRGVPFLAMPLLKGETLDECLKRQGVTPVAEVLRVGRETAEGLAAAHERGLVHRDVKPGNLWLEAPDERRRVKILDFGLARAANNGDPLSRSGVVIGTPAYMAPEQAREGAIDPRCDLFSLGCVLYRMATGRLPFQGTDTLSTLAAVALDTPAPPRELNPAVPQALSDLVMRLLAKQPAERPPSARAVVETIRAIERAGEEGAGRGPALKSGGSAIQSERVRQGPPAAETTAAIPLAGSPRTPAHRRWLVVLAAGFLCLGGLLAAVVYVKTDRGTLEIDALDDDVAVTVEQGGKVVTVLDRKTGKSVELASGAYTLKLDEGAAGLELSATEFTLTRGGKRIVVVRKVPGAPAAVRPAKPKTGEILRFGGQTPEVNVPAVSSYERGAHPVNRYDIKQGVNGLAVSGDGRRAVSTSWHGPIRAWDVDVGKEVRRFESGDALGVAPSADGRRALVGVLGWKGFSGAILWDVDAGKEIRRFPMGQSWSNGLALSADGRRALVSGLWSTFVLWDADTGKAVRRYASPGRIVTTLALSPDGRLALNGSDHDSVVRLWNVEKGTQERVFVGHGGPIQEVVFSPDGRRALSGSADATMRLWDVGSGKELRTFEGHAGTVYSVAYAPDGLRVLSGGCDGTVRLWDVETGKELRRFTGHTGAVLCVTFLPDGRRALSGGEDGSIRLWDLESPDAAPAAGER